MAGKQKGSRYPPLEGWELTAAELARSKGHGWKRGPARRARAEIGEGLGGLRGAEWKVGRAGGTRGGKEEGRTELEETTEHYNFGEVLGVSGDTRGWRCTLPC